MIIHHMITLVYIALVEYQCYAHSETHCKCSSWLHGSDAAARYPPTPWL